MSGQDMRKILEAIEVNESESIINESKEQVLTEMLNLNALQQMSEAQRLAIVDWLGETYDEWVQEGTTGEDLMIGVDILLEALGREGHFFTEETDELDEGY